MTDEDDKKKSGQENGGSERLPQDEYDRDEYDRLVQGCEEFYFGPGADPEGEVKPRPKETGDGSPKDAGEAG